MPLLKEQISGRSRSTIRRAAGLPGACSQSYAMLRPALLKPRCAGALHACKTQAVLGPSRGSGSHRMCPATNAGYACPASAQMLHRTHACWQVRVGSASLRHVISSCHHVIMTVGRAGSRLLLRGTMMLSRDPFGWQALRLRALQLDQVTGLYPHACRRSVLPACKMFPQSDWTGLS